MYQMVSFIKKQEGDQGSKKGETTILNVYERVKGDSVLKVFFPFNYSF